MKQWFFAPSAQKGTGRRTVVIFLVAAFSIIAGMVITANLDLSPSAVAEPPLNMFETGALPVVERDGDLESPFVSVVEQVQNAVVNISARTRDRAAVGWWERTGYATSSGSGFFFREDGYVLTNSHVIQDAVKVTVRTASGYDYDAEIVGTDPQTDLAVLKVEPEEEITVIPFGNSDEVKVGDWAIAIGNPFPRQGLDRTVTVGVVSGIGRSNLHFGRETPDYQYYIQTDASINPGNSGGPLLNLRGECIAVNAAITTPTGASVGIGFAIPINLARAVVPDLIAYGKPQRGWLGIWLSPVTARDAKRQGLEAVKGVKIDSVFNNSPADRAGLQGGDIVVGFNKHEVETVSQLSVLVSTVKAGQPVPVDIVRDGSRVTFTTVIADRDRFLASIDDVEPDEDDELLTWMGMELTTFSRDIARALGIKNIDGGVYVQGVYAGSPADRASIAKGTIITQINDDLVKSISDVLRVSDAAGTGDGRFALIVVEPDGTIARKVIRPQ